MKLATYRDGSRDGQLVVVSRDLSQAHYATGIATRLQQVLDDWNFLSPLLQDLSVTLNQGKARHAFPFEPRQCMAPLPRAFGWVVPVAPAGSGSADGASQAPDGPPDHPAEDPGAPAAAPPPALLQGASDAFLGPCQDAWLGASAWGLSAGPGLAVVTGDVGMGAHPAQGLDGVRLLVLATEWRLDALADAEADRGAPLLQGLPAAAFGPVAVTPDELGPAWHAGRVALALRATVSGPSGRADRAAAQVDAAAAMPHDFGTLLAHLAMTRDLRAGLVVGSGALLRLPGLALGDCLQVDLTGADGQSVFGAIRQRVAGPQQDTGPADDDRAPDAAPDSAA